jgi:hypothetical protein
MAFLMIAINIAKPCCFKLDPGIAIFNNKFYEESKAFYHHINDDGDMLEHEWPKIAELDIKKVWLWLKKQQGVFHGLSNNRTGRVLNSFSYLFNNQDDVTELELLWSMVGLEAQYVTSNDDSKLNHLTKNSRQLIGHTNASAKLIKEMYNLRSRFFHGEKNFPNKFNSYPGDMDDFEAFQLRIYETTRTAIRMLICTIQKLFLKDNPTNQD